jgi:DNA-binding NarL/FixJ family response regulator
MREKLSVVLIEGAFLLQSGIQNLISEYPELKLKAVYDGTEKNLAGKVTDQKIDLLLIDPEIEGFDIRAFMREVNTTNRLTIVGLVDRHTPPNVISHFQHTLNLKYCKYDLLESLKAILGGKLLTGEKNLKDKDLSTREKTILIEIVLGLTNQEIADKFFLSIHTVATHRKNLTNKLGIKTVSGLTVYALLNKLVNIHDIEHK